LAEAMASGLPVIVTGYGAALDFCSENHAYLLPAREQRLAHKRIGAWETADHPWLAEPDAEALRQRLRHVFDDSSAARIRGEAGAEFVRRHFTWEQTADAVERRLLALGRRPVRRWEGATPPTSRPP
jgi:glycosyltransferase involved in cell wall biosynthesis